MSGSRIGISTLKGALEDLQNDCRELERQQSLLSMRLTLTCDKMHVIATALKNWEKEFSNADPTRSMISLGDSN